MFFRAPSPSTPSLIFRAAGSPRCRGAMLLLVLSGCGSDQVAPPPPPPPPPAGPLITGVAPNTLVEGATATIVGSGLGNSTGTTQVMLDNLSAAITAVSDSQITFVVPNRQCAPAGSTRLRVTTSIASADTAVFTRPELFEDLAVGERTVFSDPTEFCLQLQATSGPRGYLLGLSLPAELRDLLQGYQILGVAGGQGTAIRGPALVPEAQSQEAVFHTGRWNRPWRSVARAPAAPLRTMAQPPMVGDNIPLKVPNYDLDFDTGCSAWFDVDTRVVFVGARSAILVDTLNPAGAFTDPELQVLGAQYDATIAPLLEQRFGASADLDNNGVQLILFTRKVNEQLGGFALAFVSPTDVEQPGACPSSNVAEIFYASTPDPTGVIGGVQDRAGYLDRLPSVAAHEMTHLIQVQRRLVLSPDPAATLNATWEMEGQANLAEELLGHVLFGNMPGQNYGGMTAVVGDPALYYSRMFRRLSSYFGGQLSGGQISRLPGAPAQCTMYGEILPPAGPPQPCTIASYFYGVSWSLQRYVLDRFGAGFPGGVGGLTRAWIDANPSLAGSANVEAVLGVPWDDLFVDWATTLWADDRPGITDPRFAFPSWQIRDVLTDLGNSLGTGAENFQLAPIDLAYDDIAAFTGQVRGGSTAYHHLRGTGPLPALAIRLTATSGQPLPGTARPRLWILRTE